MNGSKPSRLLVARTFEPTSTRSQRTPALSTDQTDMSNPPTTPGMLEVRPPAPFAAGTAAATAAGTTRHHDAPVTTPAGQTPVQPLIQLVGDTVGTPMPPDVETVASTFVCEDEDHQDVDMAPDDDDLFADPNPQGRPGVEAISISDRTIVGSRNNFSL